ncbi:MAG: tetrahydrofolate dehydrogenase/cyclohydrolase catalytic domain-containing protein [Promethearchaeota archaeon]|jgi:methylenetetrahydrofolate dehydrogenase (NADP+)/methenyltetrahydrofolate cyclohydrolase
MPLIDCSKIAKSILSRITKNSGRLVIIRNYDDPSVISYTLQVIKEARKLGIEVVEEDYGSSYLPESITRLIHEYNNDPEVNGIILVSPHPKQYACLHEIVPSKRVEGTDFDDNPNHVSCSARACVEVIKSVADLTQKNVLVIGYGKVVGKPLAYLLMRMHAGSVTTTHQYTKMEELFGKHIPDADIIVSAVGSPHLITGDYKGKVFIDAGISVSEGRLHGDIHPDLIEHNEVTPVPGGIGPITTALLLENVSLAAEGKF